MKHLFTALAVLTFYFTIYAQVVEDWVRTYSWSYGVDARASIIDSNGNVYITGAGGDVSATDFITVKYNSDGFFQWEATYDGGIGDHDYATAIAIDPLGYVYVTGMSVGAGTGDDFLTIKYDSQGNELWTQRYHGNQSFTTYNLDRPWAIAVDDQGNVYVTGESVPTGATSGWGTCITIKYSTNGVPLWAARVGGEGGYGRDVKVDADGNVYVFGIAPGISGSGEWVIVKYDSSGNQQWVKRYSPVSPGPRAMDIDKQGNVYVTGIAGFIADIHTIKYSSAGDSLWAAIFEFADPSDIVADESGNVFITGKASNATYTGSEYITIKYNPSGQEEWSARYDEPEDDRFVSWATSIALDTEGNVYVTGQSQGANFLQGDARDIATVKYNNNGVEQWAVRYHHPPNGDETAIKVHVDEDGAVYVTGWGRLVPGDPSVFIAIKYSQSPNDVEGESSINPDKFSLAQNYPNPFNPSTNFEFRIADFGFVTLKIYDILGREVATLVNEEKPAGNYKITFDASRMASGVYFYKLQTITFSETKKMVLIR